MNREPPPPPASTVTATATTVPGSRRLAAMMQRTAGVGPWPEASERGLAPAQPRTFAPAPAGPPAAAAAAEGSRQGSGTKISARLGALATRLVATASATYAQIGLGSVEAKVLLIVGEAPHTSSEIGRVIGVDRAAVCRAVQSLGERGLVTKLSGKARAVRLTAEGEALIASIHRLSAEREKRLLAGFSNPEVGLLMGFLGRLMLNVPELAALAESGAFEDMRQAPAA